MKNKIEITKNAQNHIADVIKNDKKRYFRITVLGGGCAGFQYQFDFDNKKNEDDFLFEAEKVLVLIDNTSLELINGSKRTSVDSDISFVSWDGDVNIVAANNLTTTSMSGITSFKSGDKLNIKSKTLMHIKSETTIDMDATTEVDIDSATINLN